jgi:integrase
MSAAQTYLLRHGVRPKVVQELLGHSCITLTMNTYGHVLPTLLKQVASHMGRATPR